MDYSWSFIISWNVSRDQYDARHAGRETANREGNRYKYVWTVAEIVFLVMESLMPPFLALSRFNCTFDHNLMSTDPVFFLFFPELLVLHEVFLVLLLQ